jgi:hypothetical protein
MMANATSSGNEKLRATLMNHASKKEYICRKLGIVSDADIQRHKKMQKR